MTSVDEIITRIADAAHGQPGLGGTLKLDFGGDGSIYVDGTSTPPNAVSEGTAKSADTTLSLTMEDFKRMVRGELDPTSAFMQGKLKVAGNMGLAMKLGPMLSKARA